MHKSPKILRNIIEMKRKRTCVEAILTRDIDVAVQAIVANKIKMILIFLYL